MWTDCLQTWAMAYLTLRTLKKNTRLLSEEGR